MSKNTATPAVNDQQNQQAATNTAASSTLGQVQGQDVSVGTGAEAKAGDTVSVLYVGKLEDGTVFDSSAAHNNEPLKFVLGTNELIPGFQIGINGMKVGGERLLSIPPTLAYGDQEVKDPATGKVVIPANSTILFDVKLVAVEPGTTTPAQQ
ncbi:FKBP-type peptidyl-prolyl cis-trans isomerase [Candidatus Parcubacteria bacterium]|nr:MAG: FKBP-type peptidyl-prolyl cis-trans isomerase [Candidatus Parcubacteria bacterium]